MGCKPCTEKNIINYDKESINEKNELSNKINLNYIALKTDEYIQNFSNKKSFKEKNLSNFSSDCTNHIRGNIYNLNYEF